MKCAIWPGAKEGTEVPEHVPAGLVRLWHVAVTLPAGAVPVSFTLTLVNVTLPELVTVNV